MDIPKFKDLIQKLGFLRNYSSLILPVIIMLVGVLLFIPTRLMSSRLKKQIADESVSIGKRVQSLAKVPFPATNGRLSKSISRLMRQMPIK